MKRTITITTAAVAGLLLLQLPGCGRHTLRGVDSTAESAWQFHHGTSAATGSVEGTFNGRLNIVWQHRTNAKPAGPLTLTERAVVYPGTKKKVEFFDIETGKHLGRIKTGGLTQTGLVVSDSLAFYALAAWKNRAEGLNYVNGKSLWKVRIKEPTPGTILVHNSLIISSSSGIVYSLEYREGSPNWETRLEERCSAAPTSAHGLVYQPVDGGMLVALDLESGEEQFRVRAQHPITAAVSVSDLAYVADIGGTVQGVHPTEGNVVWKTDVGGPVWSPVTVSGGRLYVSHSGGKVVSLDAASGKKRWEYDCNAVLSAATAVAGNVVIAATMTGQVVCLDVDTGRLIDSHVLEGAVSQAPITNGERVFVATDKGYIACFGEPNEQHAAND